jgi:L-seryl-tRNA(Ser) seleniumtransferase
MSDNPYRALPAVHEVLTLLASQPSPLASEAVRATLDALRKEIAAGKTVDLRAEAVAHAAAERLVGMQRPGYAPVLNATGVILHTNLGRAPLHPSAADAARRAAAGYLSLEIGLESGERSSRMGPLRGWLCRATGAEAATAVNNNAAATILALRALCAGKEAILSRGQLIEIGGSFRIPEIMATSGAILREVGTTNITRLSDYDRAVGPNTGAILRIHTSNYRIEGFTSQPSLAELAGLAHAHGLPLIDDLGSGALVSLARFGFPDEPVARDSIAGGADLALFSGDKLLGGPQAGIIAGRKPLIERIEKDPLMRAFRLDKMTLAALEATLRLYVDEETAFREVPVLRLLSAPLGQLQARAEALASRLAGFPGLKARTARDEAYVGGGSLPGRTLPTWVVEAEAPCGAAELALRLRMGTPAVLPRVRGGKVLLDMRALLEGQDDALAEAVRAAVMGRTPQTAQ